MAKQVILVAIEVEAPTEDEGRKKVWHTLSIASQALKPIKWDFYPDITIPQAIEPIKLVKPKVHVVLADAMVAGVFSSEEMALKHMKAEAKRQKNLGLQLSKWTFMTREVDVPIPTF